MCKHLAHSNGEEYMEPIKTSTKQPQTRSTDHWKKIESSFASLRFAIKANRHFKAFI